VSSICGSVLLLQRAGDGKRSDYFLFYFPLTFYICFVATSFCGNQMIVLRMSLGFIRQYSYYFIFYMPYQGQPLRCTSRNWNLTDDPCHVKRHISSTAFSFSGLPSSVTEKNSGFHRIIITFSSIRPTEACYRYCKSQSFKGLC
jgi:hypothetical protein